MTKKDKELLLKDLCARLPYGVKCDWNGKAYELVEIDIKRGLVYIFRYDWIEPTSLPYSIPRGDEIKPYLRPMSSMTEKEKKEYNQLCYNCQEQDSVDYNITELDRTQLIYVIDWLNAHYFDFCGLIPMGLAIEAPKDMYNF